MDAAGGGLCPPSDAGGSLAGVASLGEGAGSSLPERVGVGPDDPLSVGVAAFFWGAGEGSESADADARSPCGSTVGSDVPDESLSSDGGGGSVDAAGGGSSADGEGEGAR